MSRTDAQRRNATALRFRHSQSLLKRRHRLSQAMVRSTIQRFGSTTNVPVLQRLAISTFTVNIEVVKRSDVARFVVLLKRWIVERTIAWLNRCRWLAKD